MNPSRVIKRGLPALIAIEGRRRNNPFQIPNHAAAMQVQGILALSTGHPDCDPCNQETKSNVRQHTHFTNGNYSWNTHFPIDRSSACQESTLLQPFARWMYQLGLSSGVGLRVFCKLQLRLSGMRLAEHNMGLLGSVVGTKMNRPKLSSMRVCVCLNLEGTFALFSWREDPPYDLTS